MVLRYTPEQWRAYSEAAHSAVFERMKPADWDRISYALVAVDDKREEPIGYVTVRENDPESVYWQFGGAFPRYRKSTWAVRAYDELLRYQALTAKRVGTYVENSNLPMLKLALGYGFLIVGTRTYGGSTYVDMIKELKS